VTSDGLDWLALDEALDALRERDERRHQVVMLRFFAGLGEADVAGLLGVDVRTVRRDWVTAKLWLYSHLSGHPPAA
jgi:DNA-directed RNA polymerase specialized sigma24 family protein